ncbi:MAG TPA: CPXCG motif-containing cysteine-rich protein [Terriglobales bacterium]|nr:CPXCG motif-containing cysteine-rich protein [Terriglobales bacterium]
MTLPIQSSFQCAGCGEWNDADIDESAGRRRQSYVQDCQVCCQPNVLEFRWDSESRRFRVSAEIE